MKRLAGLALAAAVVTTTPVPAAAQEEISEARIRKLEAEIRALQRQVFPGGDARFFEPEISPQQDSGAASNAPSTSAVTDILARLDAMEAQLQRLTAAGEENQNAVSLLSERIEALEAVNAAEAAAAEAATVAEEVEASNDTEISAVEPAATDANLAAMTNGASEATAEAPEQEASTGPTEERLASVQEIAKPQTNDAGDDEYIYGFRLWNAGFYPEAQQQLNLFVDQNPDHWRTTYGRNLLGRAYLDDGKAREAAPWFLRNYQTDKQAARAGDSLLFLAEAMIALEDTNRACIALAEFGETYPALASGRLQEQYEANRRNVTCN